MTLLRIRGLRTYLRTDDGTARAVDGVDLDVDPGEAVGIVGESGSGKTLLALSILGLLPQGGREIQAGSSILFKEEELVGMKRRSLRRICCNRSAQRSSNQPSKGWRRKAIRTEASFMPV